jgi:hypothetical protein
MLMMNDFSPTMNDFSPESRKQKGQALSAAVSVRRSKKSQQKKKQRFSAASLLFIVPWLN